MLLMSVPEKTFVFGPHFPVARGSPSERRRGKIVTARL